MKTLFTSEFGTTSSKFLFFGPGPEGIGNKTETTPQTETNDLTPQGPEAIKAVKKALADESDTIANIATPDKKEAPVSYSRMASKNIDKTIQYLSNTELNIAPNEIRTIDLKISNTDATPDKMSQLMNLVKGKENISLELTIGDQSLPSNVLQDMYHDQETRLITPQEKIQEITNKEMTLREKARQAMEKSTETGHGPSMYDFENTLLVKMAKLQRGDEYVNKLIENRYNKNPIDALENDLKSNKGLNHMIQDRMESLAKGQAGASNVALAQTYTKENYEESYNEGQRKYVYTRKTPFPQNNPQEQFAKK